MFLNSIVLLLCATGVLPVAITKSLVVLTLATFYIFNFKASLLQTLSPNFWLKLLGLFFIGALYVYDYCGLSAIAAASFVNSLTVQLQSRLVNEVQIRRDNQDLLGYVRSLEADKQQKKLRYSSDSRILAQDNAADSGKASAN